MAAPDWNKVEDWDSLYLGGVRVPGIVRLSVQLPSGLDVCKPKGGKKATIKDQGAPPAQISVEVELMPEDLGEFQASVIPMMRPPAKDGARPPLVIAHPQAALWGINVVTVGEVNAPHPASGGTLIVEFTLYEWAPAPTKVKKSATKPKDDPAEHDVQPAIDELNASLPGANGAAAKNYSSPDDALASFP